MQPGRSFIYRTEETQYYLMLCTHHYYFHRESLLILPSGEVFFCFIDGLEKFFRLYTTLLHVRRNKKAASGTKLLFCYN